MIKSSIAFAAWKSSFLIILIIHYDTGSAELYFYDGTVQSHFADHDLAPFFAIPDVRATWIPSILVPRSIDDNKGRRPRSKEIPGDRDVKNPISPIESKNNVTRRTSLRKKNLPCDRILLPPRHARRGRSAFLKRSIRVFGSARCRARLLVHNINIYQLSTTYEIVSEYVCMCAYVPCILL